MFARALLGFALVVAVTTTQVSAQQSPPPPASAFVGLPVYSSDGQQLGQVISANTAVGKTSLRVEMGTFLGLGPSQILVDPGLYQRNSERIELSMTADQVKETISQQNKKQQR